MGVTCSRRVNNHTELKKAELLKLAAAIDEHYGPCYGPCVEYLKKLANNRLWEDARLRSLPWHASVPVGPQALGARFELPQALQAALAPAIPLKAVFSRGAG